MGEIFDIGRKLDERRAFNQPYYRIEVPDMLSQAIHDADPLSEKGSDDIVEDYQRAIMGGISARDALRQAIIRARRIG